MTNDNDAPMDPTEGWEAGRRHIAELTARRFHEIHERLAQEHEASGVAQPVAWEDLVEVDQILLVDAFVELLFSGVDR